MACVFRFRVYREEERRGEVDGYIHTVDVDVRMCGGRRRALSCFALWSCYGTLDGSDTRMAEGKGRSRVHRRRGYILAADPTPAAPDPGRLN